MVDKLTILYLVLGFVWIHFISDFILQSDKMAINKSSKFHWLFIHCLTYSAFFLVLFGPLFSIVNGILHGITDFCSSKATSYFHKKGDRHNFFVVIGF